MISSNSSYNSSTPIPWIPKFGFSNVSPVIRKQLQLMWVIATLNLLMYVGIYTYMFLYILIIFNISLFTFQYFLHFPCAAADWIVRLTSGPRSGEDRLQTGGAAQLLARAAARPLLLRRAPLHRSPLGHHIPAAYVALRSIIDIFKLQYSFARNIYLYLFWLSFYRTEGSPGAVHRHVSRTLHRQPDASDGQPVRVERWRSCSRRRALLFALCRMCRVSDPSTLVPLRTRAVSERRDRRLCRSLQLDARVGKYSCIRSKYTYGISFCLRGFIWVLYSLLGLQKSEPFGGGGLPAAVETSGPPGSGAHFDSLGAETETLVSMHSEFPSVRTLVDGASASLEGGAGGRCGPLGATTTTSTGHTESTLNDPSALSASRTTAAAAETTATASILQQQQQQQQLPSCLARLLSREKFRELDEKLASSAFVLTGRARAALESGDLKGAFLLIQRQAFRDCVTFDYWSVLSTDKLCSQSFVHFLLKGIRFGSIRRGPHASLYQHPDRNETENW